MTSFEVLLVKLADAFDRAAAGYMVIGDQAALVHGEPRQTRDIDVTLAVDCGQADAIIATLKPLGLRPLSSEPAAFARQTNALPLEDDQTGLRADIVFSEFPYEREAVRRGAAIPIMEHPVRFVAAEDLIIHKLVAGRPIDLQDVRGVWLRKGKQLDTAYIDRWLGRFSQVPGLEGVEAAWRSCQA